MQGSTVDEVPKLSTVISFREFILVHLSLQWCSSHSACLPDIELRNPGEDAVNASVAFKECNWEIQHNDTDSSVRASRCAFACSFINICTSIPYRGIVHGFLLYRQCFFGQPGLTWRFNLTTHQLPLSCSTTWCDMHHLYNLFQLLLVALSASVRIVPTSVHSLPPRKVPF